MFTESKKIVVKNSFKLEQKFWDNGLSRTIVANLDETAAFLTSTRLLLTVRNFSWQAKSAEPGNCNQINSDIQASTKMDVAKMVLG